MSDCDCNEGAGPDCLCGHKDRIHALEAERDALKDSYDVLREVLWKQQERAERAEAERDALKAHADAMVVARNFDATRIHNLGVDFDNLAEQWRADKADLAAARTRIDEHHVWPLRFSPKCSVCFPDSQQPPGGEKESN